MKSFNVEVAFWSYCPIRPAIRGKRKILGAVSRCFLKLRDKQCASKGRLKRRDQETVIRARLVAGDRAVRVAANAVGHEPLDGFGGAQVAANFAAEIHGGRQSRTRTVGGRVHLRIMEPSWRLDQKKIDLYSSMNKKFLSS